MGKAHLLILSVYFIFNCSTEINNPNEKFIGNWVCDNIIYFKFTKTSDDFLYGTFNDGTKIELKKISNNMFHRSKRKQDEPDVIFYSIGANKIKSKIFDFENTFTIVKPNLKNPDIKKDFVQTIVKN